MPAPRAVLADLIRLGLDPRVHHKTLKDGHISARTDAAPEPPAPAPAPVPEPVHHGPLMPTTTHVVEETVDAAPPPPVPVPVPEPVKKKVVGKKKEKPEEG